MLDLKFHHIGYAVKNIDQTSAFYLKQGWKITQQVIDPIQNTKIAFLSKEDFPLIELVAPIDEQSPVVKTLGKVGVCPYHICYSVDDIEQTILELRKDKFIVLFQPVKAVALNNKLICYLYNTNVGLLELVEE